eukprot:RCo038878
MMTYNARSYGPPPPRQFPMYPSHAMADEGGYPPAYGPPPSYYGDLQALEQYPDGYPTAFSYPVRPVYASANAPDYSQYPPEPPPWFNQQGGGRHHGGRGLAITNPHTRPSVGTPEDAASPTPASAETLPPVSLEETPSPETGGAPPTCSSEEEEQQQPPEGADVSAGAGSGPASAPSPSHRPASTPSSGPTLSPISNSARPRSNRLSIIDPQTRQEVVVTPVSHASVAAPAPAARPTTPPLRSDSFREGNPYPGPATPGAYAEAIFPSPYSPPPAEKMRRGYHMSPSSVPPRGMNAWHSPMSNHPVASFGPSPQGYGMEPDSMMVSYGSMRSLTRSVSEFSIPSTDDFYVPYEPPAMNRGFHPPVDAPMLYSASGRMSDDDDDGSKNRHWDSGKAVPSPVGRRSSPGSLGSDHRTTYTTEYILSLAKNADPPPSSLTASELFRGITRALSAGEIREPRREFGTKSKNGEARHGPRSPPAPLSEKQIKPVVMSSVGRPPLGPAFCPLPAPGSSVTPTSPSPVSGFSPSPLSASVAASAKKLYDKLGNRADRAFNVKNAKEVTTDEEILKRIRGILNKLTREKYTILFERLWTEMMGGQDDFLRLVERVIGTIFDVSLDQPSVCHLYADLCHDLRLRIQHHTGEEMVKPSAPSPIGSEKDAENTEPRQPGSTLKEFRRILLNRCQHRFEEGSHHTPPVIPVTATPEEREQISKQEEQFRRRTLGNIRFISELYKRSLLSERIMHAVIKVLLLDTDHNDASHADLLEALCLMLQTVGGELDRQVAKQFMDHYFLRLEAIAANHPVVRIRFLVLDVIELRRAGWKNRFDERAASGAVTPTSALNSSSGSFTFAQPRSTPTTPASHSAVTTSPIAGPRWTPKNDRNVVSPIRNPPSKTTGGRPSPSLRNAIWKEVPNTAPVSGKVSPISLSLSFDERSRSPAVFAPAIQVGAASPSASQQQPQTQQLSTSDPVSASLAAPAAAEAEPPRGVCVSPSAALTVDVAQTSPSPLPPRAPVATRPPSRKEVEKNMREKSHSFLQEWIECQGTESHQSAIANLREEVQEQNYAEFYTSMILNAVGTSADTRGGLAEMFSSLLSAGMIQQEHLDRSFVETILRCVKKELWLDVPKLWLNLSLVLSSCIRQSVIPATLLLPMCEAFFHSDPDTLPASLEASGHGPAEPSPGKATTPASTAAAAPRVSLADGTDTPTSVVGAESSGGALS